MAEGSKRYSFWKYPYTRLGRHNTTSPIPYRRTSDGLASPTPQIPAPPIKSTAEVSVVTDVLRPVTSWPALIVACLVCLLLGSLMRSMLSEADFVIYSPDRDAIPEGETWRELKRLLEWRIGWDRDLIIAIARRA